MADEPDRETKDDTAKHQEEEEEEEEEEENEEEDDSDVEMEGVEMGDSDEASDVEDDYDSYKSPSERDDHEEEDETESNENLVQEELRDYEEAQKERMELMAAEAGDPKIDTTVNPDNRLQYLLSQSEVFAHFLAGNVASDKNKNKTVGGKGGRASKRMTEAEEDSQMLKAAQSKRRGIVRLDKQPSNLAPHCKMHPYQLEGLNWLIKLHDHGINGILADEMGLGKTLQTISLLAYLREARGVRGPHIIVAPKIVVGNWIKEFRKWCPCFKTAKMLGDKESRKKVMTEDLVPDPKTGKRKIDVLVTSYEGVLKERNALGKIHWEYLIIDEAHRIKNEKSSLSKAVRLLTTRYRVLITGTPLQNNLHELWALLNFLLPDIFSDSEQFDEWFSLSGDGGQENVIRKLHTVLRPFMLRRVKKDVACALPPKKETKLFVGLTQLQQEWYTRILRKDAHELNSLGGPDRVRLLNILMQLRKVCNHPYLFDGAEPGPPYSDGPHLWETAGKTMLLHKLLPKLRQKGSRVLIFTQMTRVLDILEDYFRFVRYEYCRIDGSTPGELRDTQMEAFNEEGSTKFAFLLSTRAGGLGINLHTADIVILYDSDWNPQVDLQAMDRAHRIGQKKPVQVFRFVTEGSVEEKIIERADRKLFLDAAVIQQGRLAEQFNSADKSDLMRMVRFGADQILKNKGGTYTDEDIDALIAKGEQRTNAIQAKLQTDAQHNLASFSLLGDDDQKDIMSFDGKNYRDQNDGETGNFINLPQRERKRNYDVNEYYREAMNAGTNKMRASEANKKRKKGPNLQDFQLYDRERFEAINEKERFLAMRKEEEIHTIKELRLRAKHAPSIHNSRTSVPKGQSSEELRQQADVMESRLNGFDLPANDQAEKEQLLKEGFPDWTKKDFKAFCSSLERHGRFDVASIVDDVVRECGKEEVEIKRYYVAFWKNYRRINDWKKILERIERGEKKIQRLKQIKDAVKEKVERHLRKVYGALPWEENNDDNGGSGPNGTSTKPPAFPQDANPTTLLHRVWQTMTFNYGPGSKGRAYTEEEDAFLICMMHKHGYGAAERIRLEIRRAWQFRFDWYFKSRNAQEIQKRCDALIKVIERENEEVRKREEVEEDERRQREEPQARESVGQAVQLMTTSVAAACPR